MRRKRLFRPEISIIELNPEQAVLSCNCYDARWRKYGRRYSTERFPNAVCVDRNREIGWWSTSASSTS